MKKLLLSLAAMLCVSGAWADSQTTLISGVTLPGLPAGTYRAGTTVSHNGTNNAVVYDSETKWAVMQASAPSFGSPTVANFTWCNAYNGSDGSYSTTGTTWEALEPFAGSTAYTTSSNDHFVNFARRGNVRKTDRTFAYRFTDAITVSVYVKSNGSTTGKGINLAVFQVANNGTQTEVEIVNDHSQTATALTVDGLNKSNTYVAYIYGDNDSNGELYEIAFRDEDPSALNPTISASASATINATESGVEATEDIAVTGANLTGSTLTATLSPAVAGLSVTLDNSTITSGSISATATLHYTATANASGTTTLTLSDGTTSKNVTVNYSARVVAYEMVDVTGAETFNLNTVGTSLETVTPDDYVLLINAGATCSFADKLAVKGVGSLNVTWRNDAVQAGYFKFHTIVPGTVTVKFSDVGSSSGRPNRYANINGTRTDVYSNSSSSSVTSSPILVEAGDVIIKGEQDNDGFSDNQIRVFTITFTPAVTKNLSATGYASFSAPYNVTVPAGTTAYKAAVDGDAVILTSVDGVIPANTGVILYNEGKPASVVLTATSEDGADYSGNELVATSVEANKTVPAEGTFYALSATAAKFVKVANDLELSADKAYLPASSSASSLRVVIEGMEDGMETAISLTPSVVENAACYDLYGRKSNGKGLMIQNGKVVLVK